MKRPQKMGMYAKGKTRKRAKTRRKNKRLTTKAERREGRRLVEEAPKKRRYWGYDD